MSTTLLLASDAGFETSTEMPQRENALGLLS